MSWARSAALMAWPVIQVSAHALWQGRPLTGDRHTVGPSPNTHGSGGPVAACRQSRTTPPPGALVAWDMPRSPVLFARQGLIWLAGPGDSRPPGPALVFSGAARSGREAPFGARTRWPAGQP